MATTNIKSGGFRLPILQGVLPIKGSQIPAELIAGLTLAALAIPEVMGYTKIAGTPVIYGLYTILIPMALFALFGSSRHLVVGADSATAAILAAGLVGLAATGSDEYLALYATMAISLKPPSSRVSRITSTRPSIMSLGATASAPARA